MLKGGLFAREKRFFSFLPHIWITWKATQLCYPPPPGLLKGTCSRTYPSQPRRWERTREPSMLFSSTSLSSCKQNRSGLRSRFRSAAFFCEVTFLQKKTIASRTSPALITVDSERFPPDLSARIRHYCVHAGHSSSVYCAVFRPHPSQWWHSSSVLSSPFTHSPKHPYPVSTCTSRNMSLSYHLSTHSKTKRTVPTALRSCFAMASSVCHSCNTSYRIWLCLLRSAYVLSSHRFRGVPRATHKAMRGIYPYQQLSRWRSHAHRLVGDGKVPSKCYPGGQQQ